MEASTIIEERNKEIKAYLLGDLPPAAEEEIEIRLLREPNYKEEFDITVDELIDQYVSGGFEGEERERVEKYFLCSPERQQKLQFAIALKNTRATKTGTITEQKRSRAQPRRAWGSSTRYLAIAASLIIVVGLGFAIWRAYFYEPPIRRGLVALQAAYRERPIEARVSDFSYAPLPNQRGAATKVDSLKHDLAGTLLLGEATANPSASSHHAAGQYYMYEQQFTKAIAELNAALSLDPNNAKIHSDLGAALLEQGIIQLSGPDRGSEFESFGRSLNHLKKAIELDSSLLEVRFNIAILYQQMMPSEAAAAWRDYLQRDATSPWAEEARRRLAQLEGRAERTAWNIGVSVGDFLKARGNADDEAAWTLINQSYTSGGNEVANSLLDSLLSKDRTTHASSDEDVLRSLTYVAKLELDRADDHFTSDLVANYQQATSKVRDLLAEARTHMKKGYALFTQSSFKDAIAEYTTARRLYELSNDRAGTLLSTYRLAHCYTLVSDLTLARRVLKHVLAESEEKKYNWLVAQCLFGLAHVSASRNEYSQASDYSSQAMRRFEQIGDVNGVLKCLAQLADLNHSLNLRKRSLSYLSRGWQLAGEIPAEPMQRWAMAVRVAVAMGAMELDEAAVLYYRDALAVALQLERPLLISRSYGYLGTIYAKLKRYEEAVYQASKALEIGRAVTAAGGVEIVANASLQLADIRRQAGECSEAVEAYNTSIELYAQLKQEYFSYTAQKGRLQCLITYGEPDVVRNQIKTVLELSNAYRQKITRESERISFFDLQQSIYDLAVHFEFEMSNEAVAFQLSESSRARSLLDGVRSKAAVLNRGYGPDLNQPTVTNAMSLPEIQAEMPVDSQILQYAVLNDKVVLWVVTKDTIRHALSAISHTELSKRVSDYLRTLNTRPADDSTPARGGEDLYRVLVLPAEPYLDKTKFLTVVPDKILHYLPFAALVSPQTGRYLIEDYDLNVAPSSSTFVQLSLKATRFATQPLQRVLSVGDPHFARGSFTSLQRLPSAAKEANAIATFYPKRRILIGNDATEAAVQAEIGAADVVHLALHHVTDSRSEMLSGFPLADSSFGSRESDGFLQNYEIYNLNLQRAHLVVLSACQTGIEQNYGGEGAVGIARPFLVMGVPVVVASLWQVDSDAAAELMTSFHRYRTRNAYPVAQALKQSQVDMARGENTRYRHPYYWAGFTGIGGRASF